MNPQPLAPTLWRTCRVLANYTRLRILSLLFSTSQQTVSALAGRLRLQLSAASQNLRLIESRGLLSVRRVKLRAYYRINDAPTRDARILVEAIGSTFQSVSSPENVIFKSATAFTHPRRIEIYCLLKAQPQSLAQLCSATGISMTAMIRHVHKLEARGFVSNSEGDYAAVTPKPAIGRVLADLASR